VSWPILTGFTTGDTEIKAARVDAQSGSALDVPPVGVGGLPAPEYNPQVAFGAGAYLIAWEADRAYAKIFAARFTSSGSLLDPSPSPILVSAHRGPNREDVPALVADGGGYFAAWLDTRDAWPDVYAMRLGPDGTPLDPGAIAVGVTGHLKSAPVAASGAGEHLVGWVEDGEVRAARVAADGTLLDATPISVPTLHYGQPFSLCAAFDGSDFVLAWTSSPPDALWWDVSIVVQRIAADGTLAGGYLLSRDIQYLMSLASDGTHLLFVYVTDSTGFFDYVQHALLMNPDGTAAAPEQTLTLATESLGLGAGAGEFLTVFTGGGNGLGWDLYGARIGGDGTLLDPSPFPVALHDVVQWNPQVAFDGRNFLAVWDDSRSGNYNIYGARVSAAGVTVDPGGIAVAYDAVAESGAQVASNGGAQALVAYDRQDLSGGVRIYTRLFQDVDLRLNFGDACVTAGDCKSGFCVDHVCCRSACDQPCEACNVNGHGDCLTVTNPPRGDRPACADGGFGCGGICDGQNPQCVYPPTTQPCRAQSCQDGELTAAANCDGAGACPRVITSCAPYVCNGNACGTTCSDDTACAAGGYCVAPSCELKQPPGVACTAADQCASGFCDDGFCCSSNCNWQCASCGLAGHQGTCTPLPSPSSPVVGRAPCDGAGTPCAGYCNGGYTCFFPLGSCEALCAGGGTSAGYCEYGACWAKSSLCIAPDLGGPSDGGGAGDLASSDLTSSTASELGPSSAGDLSAGERDLSAGANDLSVTDLAYVGAHPQPQAGCGCRVGGPGADLRGSLALAVLAWLALVGARTIRRRSTSGGVG
jgi:hypothetical protein